MKAKLRHAVLLQLVSGSFSALGGGDGHVVSSTA